MSNPFEIELARLESERKRLDAMLDDAVAQFALVEEDMNARMKVASPAQLQALMEERARIEESLGIAALVDRIDEIRARAALVKSAAAAAA
ncbi:hypothetical protein [Magnetospirillum aberrantis]|uniref:Uncharacterized protein n=1 Tax=Magnetospirillum aberrantis SpK TaxID=908842 RepID=A0A7C9UX35_9PROT|nr:hypothetical protein [Magnetospirillum aberrantis]NFV82046.1 hypothetical protein [Magnetospirillum aberrantis SpK]